MQNVTTKEHIWESIQEFSCVKTSSSEEWGNYSDDELLNHKKAAFAIMILKKDTYCGFMQWYTDWVDLIVDFLEKNYINYADADFFFYMLTVDDSPDLLETSK